MHSLQGIFPNPRDRTCIAYDSCTGRQVLLPLVAPGKPIKGDESPFISQKRTVEAGKHTYNHDEVPNFSVPFPVT